MGLRRLELALPSVGRRRFLTAVSGGAVTPPSMGTLALWLKTVNGKVWTTSGGSTAAGNTDPLGRVDTQYGSLPSASQPTAGSRPTLGLNAAGDLEARGNGTSAALLLSSALSGLTDFTAYALGTRTAAAMWAPYGSQTYNAGLGAFGGIYSDGNTYFLTGTGAVLSTPCTATGNILARFRRSGSAVTFAVTGQASATMGVQSGSAADAWTCDALLARVGGDFTAASNGVSEWVVFSQALSASAMASLETGYFGRPAL